MATRKLRYRIIPSSGLGSTLDRFYRDTDTDPTLFENLLVPDHRLPTHHKHHDGKLRRAPHYRNND
jgi:hypothetical protein